MSYSKDSKIGKIYLNGSMLRAENMGINLQPEM